MKDICKRMLSMPTWRRPELFSMSIKSSNSASSTSQHALIGYKSARKGVIDQWKMDGGRTAAERNHLLPPACLSQNRGKSDGAEGSTDPANNTNTKGDSETLQ